MNSTGLKPMRDDRRLSVKLVAITVWLVFTVALAGWWLAFGLRQLDQIRQVALAPGQDMELLSESLQRQHAMLLSEGMVLILLLIVGGIALIYFTREEGRRIRRVEEFFASFTHDLKTSLASLRIQTESLQEELHAASEASVERKLLSRIMSDTGRLETQLENALYLAESDLAGGGDLMFESVNAKPLIQALASHWPSLKVHVDGDARLNADRRAIESIVRNLLQNAVRHGDATEMQVTLSEKGGHAGLRFVDNGRGFAGDRSKLGEIFSRQAGTSGSGLGLYLVAKLIQRQKGSAQVLKLDRGFGVEIHLPKAEGGAR